NVAGNAASPQVNSVSVSGGGSTGANTTDSRSEERRVGKEWGISRTHTGNYKKGQNGATFTGTVTNNGTASTNGTVTVTETVPSGLTLASMSGTGWTCVSTACSRADALASGSSSAVITVTVNVAGNAASPQVNSVSVSGGGSTGANTTDS